RRRRKIGLFVEHVQPIFRNRRTCGMTVLEVIDQIFDRGLLQLIGHFLSVYFILILSLKLYGNGAVGAWFGFWIGDQLSVGRHEKIRLFAALGVLRRGREIETFCVLKNRLNLIRVERRACRCAAMKEIISIEGDLM